MAKEGGGKTHELVQTLWRDKKVFRKISPGEFLRRAAIRGGGVFFEPPPLCSYIY